MDKKFIDVIDANELNDKLDFMRNPNFMKSPNSEFATDDYIDGLAYGVSTAVSAMSAILEIPTAQAFIEREITRREFEQLMKNLDLNIYCNLSGGNNMTMPSIKNYTYNPEIALTIIEWADGTKTTVRAENPNTADQYTGFVTAIAKKACGNDNTISNLFDEWAIKRPERELKKQILNNERLLEEKRIAEKRKAKKEKWLIRKEALRLKREYEAKKLANEKYGVPMDEDK